MAWTDFPAPGRGLIELNLAKKVDWEKLWKSVANNGSLPRVQNGTVSVDCAYKGQKDEGKMTDGTYRFDIQSINDGYVNWQIQAGKSSHAGVLIKCDTSYTFADLQAQLITSGKNKVLRKDA